MDCRIWALVHANTPGRTDETAAELQLRVLSMRCSAGRADALRYWGLELLRAHERTELALDECALALAMSQHARLGRTSRVAELGADLLESIFDRLRAEAAAAAAASREALCALRTCCIPSETGTMQRLRAYLRVSHFLQAHARDKTHCGRAQSALESAVASGNACLCR